MNVNAGLISSLTKIANHFVIRMKDKISQNNLPKEISDAISISPANVSGDSGSIDVIIDLKTAPMASAYEWGSGLHATKYSPMLYPIPTVKPGPLHFFWEERGKWFFGAKLPFGHPGVAPRPYIEPTLLAELPEMKKMVGEEIKAQILIGLKEMFKT